MRIPVHKPASAGLAADRDELALWDPCYDDRQAPRSPFDVSVEVMEPMAFAEVSLVQNQSSFKQTPVAFAGIPQPVVFELRKVPKNKQGLAWRVEDPFTSKAAFHLTATSKIGQSASETPASPADESAVDESAAEQQEKPRMSALDDVSFQSRGQTYRWVLEESSQGLILHLQEGDATTGASTKDATSPPEECDIKDRSSIATLTRTGNSLKRRKNAPTCTITMHRLHHDEAIVSQAIITGMIALSVLKALLKAARRQKLLGRVPNAFTGAADGLFALLAAL
ncbi:hypothetical protein WJX73_004618 [Symbiochloris irregularis]|uniref:Uncharacterized protein n=1 Tax=Symbiochloris irregularis TaxID=706552 RepID=A0AAW1NTY5_9CHLO